MQFGVVCVIADYINGAVSEQAARPGAAHQRLPGHNGVYFSALTGKKLMRSLFSTALLLFALSTPLPAQQKPQLEKMSPSELATFTHDLEHDLANWQARVGQHRSDLNPSYRMDSAVLRNFELLDGNIKQLRADIKELSGKDSLANDVSVYSSLEDITSTLDLLSGGVADAPSMDALASPKFRDVGDIWAHTVMDVREEVRHYTMRFYGHTLASAILADLALEVGCLAAQPKKTAK